MVTTAEALAVLYPMAQLPEDYTVVAPGVITYWNAPLLGPQPSQATIDAVTPAQVDNAIAARHRQQVLNALSEIDRNAQLTRAAVLVILDEFNQHALKINAILDAVDGANTLGVLKSAVAAIADYPQRTNAQLINAIQSVITAGDVD